MVKNIMSLTRSGVRDWLVQRISSIVLAAYIIFLLFYCFSHSNIDYLEWQSLFSSTAMRVFNVIVLLSLILHAWIGMWTISTDYLKSTFIRLAFQAIVALNLLACFIWGIQIFWGV